MHRFNCHSPTLGDDSINTEPKTYFWPYDIFGYLLPGSVAIAPLIAFHSGVRSVFEARYQAESIAGNVALLIVVYVVGHILSGASSFLLERCLLRLSFGYPLNQFLCGHFAGTLGRQIAIRVVNIARWPVVRELPTKGKFVWAYRSAEFVGDWAERRLDLLPGFCHPFDPRMVRLIQKRFELRFGVTFRNWSIRRRTHDVYWTVWAYIAENMPMSYRTGMHFVELYGFCRNASFAFIVVALYPLCPEWSTASLTGKTLVSDNFWMLASITCSAALYVNFTKLIRRQNDFILRAFISEQKAG